MLWFNTLFLKGQFGRRRWFNGRAHLVQCKDWAGQCYMFVEDVRKKYIWLIHFYGHLNLMLWYSTPFETIDGGPLRRRGVFQRWKFNVPSSPHQNIFAQLLTRWANETEQTSPLISRRRSAAWRAVLTNTNRHIKQICTYWYFLIIKICICQNSSFVHLFGSWAQYLDGGLVEHRILNLWIYGWYCDNKRREEGWCWEKFPNNPVKNFRGRPLSKH